MPNCHNDGNSLTSSNVRRATHKLQLQIFRNRVCFHKVLKTFFAPSICLPPPPSRSATKLVWQSAKNTAFLWFSIDLFCFYGNSMCLRIESSASIRDETEREEGERRGRKDVRNRVDQINWKTEWAKSIWAF